MVAAVLIMLPLIAGLKVLGRLALGDRLRKATTKELRAGAAFIAYMPVWGGLYVYFGKSYLDKAGPVFLWFYMMGCTLVFGAWILVCVRFIPAKVSWWIGGFIWAVTIWLAFTDRLT